MTVETTPISTAIGVEVRGLSSADFQSAEVAAECQRLLAAHGVVVYRDAHISDPALVAFSRMLGEVVVAPTGGHPDFPEISPVTMDPTRSKLAGLRRSTIFWHTDGLTDVLPQKATLLTAREIADEGGDTEFANTYAAYEAMPENRKNELDRYQVVHSVAASQLLIDPEPTEKQRAAWDLAPTQVHPLVWRRRDG